GGEGWDGWGSVFAGVIDQLSRGEVVLLGVGVFDVADRSLDTRDGGGDAFVSPSADPDRPIDGGDRSDLGPPVRVHFREIIGENESSAGAVGAMDNGDGLGRQLHRGIELAKRSVIP